MRLIATQQITGDYGTVVAGQAFACDPLVGAQLLARGLARPAEAPRVLYETKVIQPEAPEVSPRLPFVTCLCLTRNRREWLPKAIENFRLQTHVNRELLIVADGDDVRDLVPNVPEIRLIHVDGHPDIAEKRNLGCARAAGEVVAHWDDDDYSAPGRIVDQLTRLVTSGKSVTGYRTMRFTDGARWWLYEGSLLFALGTSLCYRREFWQSHPFACQMPNIGEDNRFVGEAAQARELAVAEAGDLMHASIHAGNTSPRSLNHANWKLIAA